VPLCGTNVSGLDAWRWGRLLWIRTREDNLVLVAGGVAFFSILSAVPALAVVVSIYGLVADPNEIATRVNDFGAAMPTEARDLISAQLTTLAADRSGLGSGLVVSLVVTLWGASTAMKHLMVALTHVFHAQDRRGFVRQRATAMLYTFATIVFLVVVLVLVAVAPGVGDGLLNTIISVLRWPLLAVLMAASLTLLYRYGPDSTGRPRPPWRWIDRGALAATGLWLAMTIAFSLYVGHRGAYDQTYGPFVSLVLLMLWLLLSALAVLLGAEVAAELERT